jgi:hypothetical protein
MYKCNRRQRGGKAAGAKKPGGAMLQPERKFLNVNCPQALYVSLQKARKASGVTAREVLGAALDSQLDDVAALARDAGFAKVTKPRLVRMPLDISDSQRLREVADELGLDISSVLLACLRRYFEAPVRKDEPGGGAKRDKK